MVKYIHNHSVYCSGDNKRICITLEEIREILLEQTKLLQKLANPLLIVENKID